MRRVVFSLKCLVICMQKVVLTSSAASLLHSAFEKEPGEPYRALSLLQMHKCDWHDTGPSALCVMSIP